MLLLISALLPLVSSQECGTANYKSIETKPGELAVSIVGMFGAHSLGSTVFSCGDISIEGVQNMLAFQYAIASFQSRHTILQSANIQGVLLDSCGSSQRLLFDIFNLEQCSNSYNIDATTSVIGFVGPDSTSEVMAVAPVIGDLGKTIITHSASSSALIDPDLYPTLLRTVPTDDQQIPVMIKILDQMEWDKVQMVYSDDPYGHPMMEAFRRAAKSEGICIVNSERIPVGKTDADMDRVVAGLLQHQATRAVLVFANDQHVTALLSAMQRSVTSNGIFTWIGTNVWSNSQSVVDGFEDIARGAITVGLGGANSPATTAFQEYLADLDVETAAPWIGELYQEIFVCKLPNLDSKYTAPCDTASNKFADLPLNPTSTSVIAAVDALLLGFEDARSSQCEGTSALCNSFMNDPNKGVVIEDKIRGLQINGSPRFNTTSGQALGLQQVVYNFQMSGYKEVGRFEDGQLIMDNLIFTYGRQGQRIEDPTSECDSSPCVECGEDAGTTSTATARSTASQDRTTAATDGSSTDGSGVALKSGVRREGWIIALIVLAGLGILLVVVFEVYIMYKMLGSVFIREWRTIWLGQLLLLGILVCYLTLFAFVPHQTAATCTILRFGIGVSYAMCFSVLLVKLMILLSSKTVGYLKGIFQVLMFLFAWIVQIAIDAEWIILRPGQVTIDNSTGSPITVCATGFEDHVQSLVYVMFLIFVCVCLSVKAHGISTNYREGIFIGLACGFTVPVWLAWILLGFLTDDKNYEEPCLAYGLFVTATLLLLIMFLPKVRQLITMGKEGVYAEDDYAGSIIAPSMPPPPLAGETNLAYLKTPNGDTKPVILLDNGTLLRSSSSNMGTMETEQTKIHMEDKTDGDALYLRHPGSTAAAGSVRSMPISGGLYTLPRQPHRAGRGEGSLIHARSTHLHPPPGTPRTIDRRAMSEYGFGTTRSVRSVRTAPSMAGSYTGSSTLKRPKTYLDIGSL